MTAAASDTAPVATTGKKLTTMTLAMPSDREVILTRVFDAPRTLVWEAMTRPEHVRQWYGPRGYELSLCEIDLRPGGSWRYVMRAPDGKEMGVGGVYREIAAPERLVSTETFDDWPDSEAISTVTLEEKDGKTILNTRVLYPSPEVRDAVIAVGMAAGAEETFDRLAELLPTLG